MDVATPLLENDEPESEVVAGNTAFRASAWVLTSPKKMITSINPVRIPVSLQPTTNASLLDVCGGFIGTLIGIL